MKCYCKHSRGSFRKIVKRGQKLMVEKFGAASLVLFPLFMQCSQVQEVGGGSLIPRLSPQKRREPGYKAGGGGGKILAKGG